MDEVCRRYSASVVIATSRVRAFQLLTDPLAHHLFDASGMVGDPVAPRRLTMVGQVFVMNMTYTSGTHVEHYQSDNHVTALEAPSLIEWATATRGGPLLGWRWRYELEAHQEQTLVTLVYDWSGTSKENADRFGVPLVDEAGLGSSLALLSRASN